MRTRRRVSQRVRAMASIVLERTGRSAARRTTSSSVVLGLVSSSVTTIG